MILHVMEVRKLISWSNWNHPLRPKILSPLAGATGIVMSHLVMLFYFNINQSGLIGVMIYTLTAMVSFGISWLIATYALALAD